MIYEDLPINSMVISHSYVKQPDGIIENAIKRDDDLGVPQFQEMKLNWGDNMRQIETNRNT